MCKGNPHTSSGCVPAAWRPIFHRFQSIVPSLRDQGYFGAARSFRPLSSCFTLLASCAFLALCSYSLSVAGGAAEGRGKSHFSMFSAGKLVRPRSWSHRNHSSLRILGEAESAYAPDPRLMLTAFPKRERGSALRDRASTAAISSASTLAGLSCTENTYTGAGTDACTVSLTSAAGGVGVAVNLKSNNPALSVPLSVTVPAGSMSAGFIVHVNPVNVSENGLLTASAGGNTEIFSINLLAAVPALTLGSTYVSFGSVDLNTPATQSVTITSSGALPLGLNLAKTTGAGFTISGISFPATLNPGQSATLYIQFDPTAAGAAGGTVTLYTTASPGVATIHLTGTGQAASYQVSLTWNAPASSPDAVAGYNIYRTASPGSYELLNPSPDASTAFTDSTVRTSASYTYYVKSVDAEGNESGPSNTYSVTIP